MLVLALSGSLYFVGRAGTHRLTGAQDDIASPAPAEVWGSPSVESGLPSPEADGACAQYHVPLLGIPLSNFLNCAIQAWIEDDELQFVGDMVGMTDADVLTFVMRALHPWNAWDAIARYTPGILEAAPGFIASSSRWLLHGSLDALADARAAYSHNLAHLNQPSAWRSSKLDRGAVWLFDALILQTYQQGWAMAKGTWNAAQEMATAWNNNDGKAWGRLAKSIATGLPEAVFVAMDVGDHAGAAVLAYQGGKGIVRKTILKSAPEVAEHIAARSGTAAVRGLRHGEEVAEAVVDTTRATATRRPPVRVIGDHAASNVRVLPGVDADEVAANSNIVRIGPLAARARREAAEAAAAGRQPALAAGLCFTAGTEVHTPHGLTAIEEVEVGDRVLTASGSVDGMTEVDSTWRRIGAEMRDPRDPRSKISIVLLRPQAWIDDGRIRVGAVIDIDLPEMRVRGAARVISIRAAPSIEFGPGRVVLSTIENRSNTVLVIKFRDSDETLEPTSSHKLFSLDRHRWIEAGELRTGERLRAVRGEAIVASIERKLGTHTVYNFEVEAEHEYLVGKVGMRTHNDCAMSAPSTEGYAGTRALRELSERARAAGRVEDAARYEEWITRLQANPIALERMDLQALEKRGLRAHERTLARMERRAERAKEIQAVLDDYADRLVPSAEQRAPRLAELEGDIRVNEELAEEYDEIAARGGLDAREAREAADELRADTRTLREEAAKVRAESLIGPENARLLREDRELAWHLATLTDHQTTVFYGLYYNAAAQVPHGEAVIAGFAQTSRRLPGGRQGPLVPMIAHWPEEFLEKYQGAVATRKALNQTSLREALAAVGDDAAQRRVRADLIAYADVHGFVGGLDRALRSVEPGARDEFWLRYTRSDAERTARAAPFVNTALESGFRTTLAAFYSEGNRAFDAARAAVRASNPEQSAPLQALRHTIDEARTVGNLQDAERLERWLPHIANELDGVSPETAASAMDAALVRAKRADGMREYMMELAETMRRNAPADERTAEAFLSRVPDLEARARQLEEAGGSAAEIRRLRQQIRDNLDGANALQGRRRTADALTEDDVLFWHVAEMNDVQWAYFFERYTNATTGGFSHRAAVEEALQFRNGLNTDGTITRLGGPQPRSLRERYERAVAAQQAARRGPGADDGGLCFTAGTRVHTPRGLTAIERVELGSRVLTGNSSLDGATAVDSSWRRIELDMEDPRSADGVLHIALLRSPAWIDAVRARVASMIEIELPEMRVRGQARVTSIGNAPRIQSGAGRVVLSTIESQSSDVLVLKLRGTHETLEPTFNHRLYSIDRNAWVQAGKLQIGERLRSTHGKAITASIEHKPGSHTVYNFEVESEHEYLVGKLGIRSHNDCTAGSGGPDPEAHVQPDAARASTTNPAERSTDEWLDEATSAIDARRGRPGRSSEALDQGNRFLRESDEVRAVLDLPPDRLSPEAKAALIEAYASRLGATGSTPSRALRAAAQSPAFQSRLSSRYFDRMTPEMQRVWRQTETRRMFAGTFATPLHRVLDDVESLGRRIERGVASLAGRAPRYGEQLRTLVQSLSIAARGRVERVLVWLSPPTSTPGAVLRAHRADNVRREFLSLADEIASKADEFDQTAEIRMAPKRRPPWVKPEDFTPSTADELAAAAEEAGELRRMAAGQRAALAALQADDTLFWQLADLDSRRVAIFRRNYTNTIMGGEATHTDAIREALRWRASRRNAERLRPSGWGENFFRRYQRATDVQTRVHSPEFERALSQIPGGPNQQRFRSRVLLEGSNRGFESAVDRALRNVDAETGTRVRRALDAGGMCFTAGTPVHTSDGLQSIETIEVGDRVMTSSGATDGDTAVDTTWRRIEVEMEDPRSANGILSIAMLRPSSWVNAVRARVGAMIELDLHEMQVHGPARVTSIGDAQRIKPGAGRVVLSTMESQSANVLVIKLRGTDERLEPTFGHRLLSLDRNEWIEAGKLRVGERLRATNGNAVVASIARKPGTHTVYNFEVEAEHEYLVGKLGVQSHNNNPCAATPGSTRERSFADWVDEATRAIDAQRGDVGRAPHVLDRGTQFLDTNKDLRRVLELPSDNLPDTAKRALLDEYASALGTGGRTEPVAALRAAVESPVFQGHLRSPYFDRLAPHAQTAWRQAEARRLVPSAFETPIERAVRTAADLGARVETEAAHLAGHVPGVGRRLETLIHSVSATTRGQVEHVVGALVPSSSTNGAVLRAQRAEDIRRRFTPLARTVRSNADQLDEAARAVPQPDRVPAEDEIFRTPDARRASAEALLEDDALFWELAELDARHVALFERNYSRALLGNVTHSEAIQTALDWRIGRGRADAIRPRSWGESFYETYRRASYTEHRARSSQFEHALSAITEPASRDAFRARVLLEGATHDFDGAVHRALRDLDTLTAQRVRRALDAPSPLIVQMNRALREEVDAAIRVARQSNDQRKFFALLEMERQMDLSWGLALFEREDWLDGWVKRMRWLELVQAHPDANLVDYLEKVAVMGPVTPQQRFVARVRYEPMRGVVVPTSAAQAALPIKSPAPAPGQRGPIARPWRPPSTSLDRRVENLLVQLDADLTVRARRVNTGARTTIEGVQAQVRNNQSLHAALGTLSDVDHPALARALADASASAPNPAEAIRRAVGTLPAETRDAFSLELARRTTLLLERSMGPDTRRAALRRGLREMDRIEQSTFLSDVAVATNRGTPYDDAVREGLQRLRPDVARRAETEMRATSNGALARQIDRATSAMGGTHDLADHPSVLRGLDDLTHAESVPFLDAYIDAVRAGDRYPARAAAGTLDRVGADAFWSAYNTEVLEQMAVLARHLGEGAHVSGPNLTRALVGLDLEDRWRVMQSLVGHGDHMASSDALRTAARTLDDDVRVRFERSYTGEDGGLCFAAGTEVHTPRGVVAIEHVALGDRVLTIDGALESATSVDSTWRRVELEMEDPRSANGALSIALLRPSSWVEATQVRVGNLIHLELPEMHVEGEARVTSMGAAPRIDAGAGRVVLSTVESQSSSLMVLKFRGTDETLEPTFNHRLYSLDRNAWVEAGKLHIGERLRSTHGDAFIASIDRKPGTHTVYNFEVETAHEYLVSKLGVRSHNDCVQRPPQGTGARRATRDAPAMATITEELTRLIDAGRAQPEQLTFLSTPRVVDAIGTLNDDYKEFVLNLYVISGRGRTPEEAFTWAFDVSVPTSEKVRFARRYDPMGGVVDVDAAALPLGSVIGSLPRSRTFTREALQGEVNYWAADVHNASARGFLENSQRLIEGLSTVDARNVRLFLRKFQEVAQTHPEQAFARAVNALDNPSWARFTHAYRAFDPNATPEVRGLRYTDLRGRSEVLNGDRLSWQLINTAVVLVVGTAPIGRLIIHAAVNHDWQGTYDQAREESGMLVARAWQRGVAVTNAIAAAPHQAKAKLNAKAEAFWDNLIRRHSQQPGR